MICMAFHQNVEAAWHVSSKAKLEAQLAFCSGCPLHHIYLDFSKAYNSFDWARMLILLQDYGIGPNMMCLLQGFWSCHTIIPQ